MRNVTATVLLGTALLASPAQAQSKGFLRFGQVSFAATQALDFTSTRTALLLGASEGNGLMGPIVRRPALFAAVKAASTSAVIYQSNKLWKVGKKKTALIWLAGLTSAYAYIVVHNYGVVAGKRRGE